MKVPIPRSCDETKYECRLAVRMSNTVVEHVECVPKPPKPTDGRIYIDAVFQVRAFCLVEGLRQLIREHRKAHPG
jgi:hypothetical protein